MDNKFLYKSYLKSTVFESTELTEGEFWRQIKKSVSNLKPVKGTSQFINKWFGSYYKSNVGDFREYLDKFKKRQDDFAELKDFKVGNYEFFMNVKELQVLKGPNLATLGESVLTEDDIEDAEQARAEKEKISSDLSKLSGEKLKKKEDLEKQIETTKEKTEKLGRAVEDVEAKEKAKIEAQQKLNSMIEMNKKNIESFNSERDSRDKEIVKIFSDTVNKLKLNNSQKLISTMETMINKGKYYKAQQFLYGKDFNSTTPEIESLKDKLFNSMKLSFDAAKKYVEAKEKEKEQEKSLQQIQSDLKKITKYKLSVNKEYEETVKKQDALQKEYDELVGRVDQKTSDEKAAADKADELEKLTHKPEEFKGMENPEWITIENPSKQSLMNHKEFRFLTRKEYYGVYPSLLNLMFREMKTYFAAALKKDSVSGEFERDLEDKNFKVKLSFKFTAIDAKKAKNAKISPNEEDNGVIPSIVEELKDGKNKGTLDMYNVDWEFDMTVTNTNEIIQYEKECKNSGLPLNEIEKLRTLSKEVHDILKDEYSTLNATDLGDTLGKIQHQIDTLLHKKNLTAEENSKLNLLRKQRASYTSGAGEKSTLLKDLNKRMAFLYKGNFLKLVKDKKYDSIEEEKNKLVDFQQYLDEMIENSMYSDKNENEVDSSEIQVISDELNPKINDIINLLDVIKENNELEEVKIETPDEIFARAKEGLLNWLNPNRINMQNVSSNSDNSAIYDKMLIVGPRDNKRSPLIHFTLVLTNSEGNPIS